jgi:hypothetical protein
MYFIQATHVSKPLKPTLSLRPAGQPFSRPFFSRDLTHAQGTAQRVHSDSPNLLLYHSTIAKLLGSYQEYPAKSVGKQEEEFLTAALVKS